METAQKLITDEPSTQVLADASSSPENTHAFVSARSDDKSKTQGSNDMIEPKKINNTAKAVVDSKAGVGNPYLANNTIGNMPLNPTIAMTAMAGQQFGFPGMMPFQRNYGVPGEFNGQQRMGENSGHPIFSGGQQVPLLQAMNSVGPAFATQTITDSNTFKVAPHQEKKGSSETGKYVQLDGKTWSFVDNNQVNDGGISATEVALAINNNKFPSFIAQTNGNVNTAGGSDSSQFASLPTNGGVHFAHSMGTQNHFQQQSMAHGNMNNNLINNQVKNRTFPAPIAGNVAIPSAGGSTPTGAQKGNNIKKAPASALPDFLLQKNATVTSNIEPNGSNNQGVQLIVAKTKTCDMIIMVERNGQPAFTHPIESYLSNNKQYMSSVLKIEKMSNLRDPNDPMQYYGVVAKNSTYFRRKLLFLHSIQGPQMQQLNTHANRERWCQHIITFWNSPEIQRLFKFPETCRYGGDVTPQDESTAQPLSHWMTIRDTMDFILQSFPDRYKSVADVLNEPSILPYYFSNNLIPQVLNYYARYGNDSSDGGQTILAPLDF